MGEETLSGWLLSPSAVDQIEERHAGIAELRDQLDLREDLAILGEHASVGVFPEALLLRVREACTTGTKTKSREVPASWLSERIDREVEEMCGLLPNPISSTREAEKNLVLNALGEKAR
jgi:hypothetical protein